MKESSMMIGVATTVIPKARMNAAGRNTRPPRYYCWMARAVAEQGARLVIFAPDQVDFQGKSVQGYTPADPGAAFGNWVRTTTTRLPDVIYENVFVHLAIAGKTTHLRRQAKAHGIPLFNPPFPSKWQFHRWMARNAFASHLPPTETYQSAAQAIARIDEWGTAYVKPIGGYGGSGVMRIERQRPGMYRVSRDRGGSKDGRFRRELTKLELATMLRQTVRRGHVVQQQIPLLTLQGRNVDFRVVVQRGAEGSWNIVGIVPKLAAKDGVVTNIIAGGERSTVAACQALAQQEGKTIDTASLERLALGLSNLVSRRIPSVGIIGYDLGLDKNGHAWLIEANPKPARSLLTGPMIQRSARHAAQFALHLARKRK